MVTLVIPFIIGIPDATIFGEHITLTLEQLAVTVAVKAPDKKLPAVSEENAEISRAASLHLLHDRIRHRRKCVHQRFFSFFLHSRSPVHQIQQAVHADLDLLRFCSGFLILLRLRSGVVQHTVADVD